MNITDAEREVMKLLWEKEPLTANEIIAALSERMNWTDQTIKTFLNRLHNKGAVRYEKTGRTYLYYPVITQDDYFKAENRSFLQNVYSGAIGMLFSKFLEDEKLSEREIEELERILKSKKGEK